MEGLQFYLSRLCLKLMHFGKSLVVYNKSSTYSKALSYDLKECWVCFRNMIFIYFMQCLFCLIGRVIRHRACALKDTAYAIIKTELDKDFEKICESIVESRKVRGKLIFLFYSDILFQDNLTYHILQSGLSWGLCSNVNVSTEAMKSINSMAVRGKVTFYLWYFCSVFQKMTLVTSPVINNVQQLYKSS